MTEGDWQQAALKLSALTSLENSWIGRGCVSHGTHAGTNTLESWKEALTATMPWLCVCLLDLRRHRLSWSSAPMCAAAARDTDCSGQTAADRAESAPLRGPYSWWDSNMWRSL